MHKFTKKMLFLLLLLGSSSSVVFGVAETPTSQTATIWEPFNWQLGSATGNAFINQLDAEDSDWIALRYQDTTGNDSSVGDCTRSRADVIGYLSGATLIETHGNPSVIVLAACDDKDVIDDWADQESPSGVDTGLDVPSGTATYGSYNLYRVRATPTFCSNKWSSDHDTYKSIVFLAACEVDSFMGSLGGKTKFAYKNISTNSEHAADINGIFGRMNGSIGSGEFRIASDAFTDYGSDPNFVMSGGSSTIAPAPIYDSPVSPIGSGAGGSGTGYIEFDTKMDTTIAATSALTWTNTGTAKVEDIEWSGDHTITFSYCMAPSASITMTANNGSCLSPGIDQAELNGNRTGGNGDDKVWTFSY